MEGHWRVSLKHRCIPLLPEHPGTHDGEVLTPFLSSLLTLLLALRHQVVKLFSNARHQLLQVKCNEQPMPKLPCKDAGCNDVLDCFLLITEYPFIRTRQAMFCKLISSPTFTFHGKPEEHLFSSSMLYKLSLTTGWTTRNSLAFKYLVEPKHHSTMINQNKFICIIAH